MESVLPVVYGICALARRGATLRLNLAQGNYQSARLDTPEARPAARALEFGCEGANPFDRLQRYIAVAHMTFLGVYWQGLPEQTS